MPDYRGNQFVSDWLKPDKLNPEWTNAPFNYPRRTVRYTEVGENGEVERVAKELDRGFVRSLVTETLTSTGQVKSAVKSRFNFQFNPQDIAQEVSMRQDIYLPILQDPSQFAQPMSAVASFNFDILLDRTMEVANGAGIGGGAIDSPEEKRLIPPSDPFGNVTPVVDVRQFGVLSDLQVLYAIIGQGFSNNFIEDQMEQIRLQAKGDILSDTSLDDASKSAKLNELATSKFDGQVNIGNSAFLIPMPVRVVFSELFMVDGFITSTSVRFTKFNTNMVPIQATIGLGMNALYIGFARQDTFLTVQLKNSFDSQQANINSLIGKREEVLTATTASANYFVFACDDDKDWQKGIAIGTPGTPIVRYANQQYDTDYTDVEFKIGFRDAKSQGDDDKVLQLFKSGASLTMSRSWSLNVYGPYTSQSAAINDVNKKVISNSSIASGVKRVGYYTDSRTDSSADDWKEGRSRSVRSDHPATDNLSTDKLQYNAGNSSKYFVVNFKVSLTANDVTVDLEDWQALQGSDVYRYDHIVGWPLATTTTGTSTKPYTPPVRGQGRTAFTAGQE